MPLCAFLWVFGAVALCHAWSPALSSRVLKLGGLVMFREKEREREEMQCCTHSLQFFPVRISATSCLSLLLSLKISVLVLSTCLFSSWLHLPQPIFHSKPALNISEWLTEMLPDASLMPRNVSIFCAALHWNLCCRKHHSHLQVQSVNICGIPLQHFNWNLLLTLLQSALGYSAFFCCWIFFSHLLLFLSAINPNACRATGRGLQPTGVRVKEVADFKVFTKGAGSGALSVSVKGPSESDSSVLGITRPRAFLEWFPLFGPFVCIHIRVWYGTKQQNEMHKMRLSWYYSFSAGAEEQVKVRDVGNGVYECEYYPLKPGKYTVTITWGGQPIPRR